MLRYSVLVPTSFVFLWSTGFIGARYAMPHAEPFTFLALRFTLALALLGPFLFRRREHWPAWRAAANAAFAGALIHGLYLGGVFYAVRHGLPAGTAALVAGLQPLISGFLAAGFLGERVTAGQWLGLAMGLLGVGLVVLPKTGVSAPPGFETLAPAFLAVAAISLGTIWQKRFVGGVDLVTGTGIQYAGALVPVGLGALLLETGHIEWTGEFVFALLWLTLALSIGAVFMLLYMIREGAVAKVTSLLYLVPGVTAIMAFFLFGESLLPVQFAGLAVTAAGVAVATKRRDKPPPAVAA